MTTMTSEREQTAVPWPLALRVAAGVGRSGGPAMVRRAIDGAELGEGDRLVEMAPGLGTTSALLLRRSPRSWTALEPDPLAREHLERTLAGSGRRILDAEPAASGLEEESASVVVVDGLLGTLDDAGAGAVLAECARLLRAGGRLAVVDLAPAEGGAVPDGLADVGVAPRSVADWRALAEAAGLVVVGSLAGRLAPAHPRDLMRGAGPRTALRITRELARDGDLRARALAARRALAQATLGLRSALTVAEKPLVSGLRRPRRP